jgi:hypothetical protein
MRVEEMTSKEKTREQRNQTSLPFPILNKRKEKKRSDRQRHYFIYLCFQELNKDCEINKSNQQASPRTSLTLVSSIIFF